jgi:hypothetical protein
MSNLAIQLISEHKNDSALKVLQKIEKEIPAYNVPHNFRSGSLDMAQAYALLGQKAKAEEIINDLWKTSGQYLDWYLTLDGTRFSQSQNECITQLYVLQRLMKISETVDKKLNEKLSNQLAGYFDRYTGKGGYLPQ